ncbi:LysM peptidoglycan-binding domain-containing protein [Nesterenkonia alba]|uniref:LysM peptidoglycan-binding domain-containing protein n=1 Tax=Nesterenkonia alba TaxID=515814 RepID=UPI0003B56C1D|nr:LysM domain-containing protein [Nesterenkonia alba]
MRVAHRVQDLVLTGIFTAAGPVLLFCASHLLGGVPSAGILHTLESHDARAAEYGVGLLAAGTGAALSLWWCLCAAVTCLSVVLEHRSPRRRGRLPHLAPGFMRRTAALVLGIGLAASATPAAADTSPYPAERIEAPVFTATASENSSETLQEETVKGPLFTPHIPSPSAERHLQLPQRESQESTQVTVKPGDSLWTIAAEHLGPQATDWEIARHWPRWYEANRTVIGDDPALLQPGTILTPPEERR